MKYEEPWEIVKKTHIPTISTSITLLQFFFPADGWMKDRRKGRLVSQLTLNILILFEFLLEFANTSRNQRTYEKIQTWRLVIIIYTLTHNNPA